MKTQPSTNNNSSPFFSVANNQEFYPGYYAPEESPFLGLFEGKGKERREERRANRSDKNSDSGSSSGSLNSSGGGSGGGFVNVLGSLLGGTFGLASAAVPLLPALGIGSKSRIKEAQALGEIQYKADRAEASGEKQMIVIGGAFLLVIVVMVIVLRK